MDLVSISSFFTGTILPNHGIMCLMKSPYLSTSQIAKAVGVHPNTVRLYEQWGLLPPVRRSPNGYRRFTEAHLDQMRLARTALHGSYPGKNIRQSSAKLVYMSASGNLGGALEMAYEHLAIVRAEQAHAEAAVQLLERWAKGMSADATGKLLQIKDAARLLGTTIDVLRNWERNNLIRIPRNPANGYRLYGPVEISRLRVIRMLSHAGYSMMAILRMLTQLDQEKGSDVRMLLDTPRPDEDVYSASDHWITTLNEEEKRSLEIIRQLEEMIRKQQKDPQTA